MSNIGIKISKEGFDVKTIPTSGNKKNLVLLDGSNSHKLMYAGIVSATSYTHGQVTIPYFIAFSIDSATTPTVFTRKVRGVQISSTAITGLDNPSYIMVFRREL